MKKNKRLVEAKRSDVTHVGRGITNSHEFIEAMNAIAADVVAGRISTKAANAYLAEARLILKMVELQQKAQHRSVGGE